MYWREIQQARNLLDSTKRKLINNAICNNKCNNLKLNSIIAVLEKKGKGMQIQRQPLPPPSHAEDQRSIDQRPCSIRKNRLCTIVCARNLRSCLLTSNLPVSIQNKPRPPRGGPTYASMM
ncbi:hypothetical protein NECAME_10594 [Necator americanus]|uniref:Uncharacterized protein n=1 Tax=Necator americanus TaxID=51031 RepID=W2TAP9_NECAM|nr:hypothetical protein NECAME_10594 [Necator americanus]ETN78087.1 hypothetical protein NECAME_10594 [Necator americanus]